MAHVRLMRFVVPAAAVTALAAGAAFWWQRGAAPSPQEQWAMVSRYCTDCHNAAELAGGVSLEGAARSDVHAHAEVWEKVVRKLRGGLMPPPGEPRPDEQQIETFATWMEASLDKSAAGAPNPGSVPLHRLNRKEYANAVKDLLALEIDAATLLPQDDKSAGFDNIASALQVSPSFIEQSVSAARTIADRALGEPNAAPESQTYKNPTPGVAFGSTSGGGRPDHVDGLPLGTRDGYAVNHFFPADGEYQINIADLVGALWVYNLEFENTLIVTVDGVKVYQVVIGGEADQKAIDQDQDPAVAAINSRLKNIRFKAKAGQQKVAVAFLRRTHAESDDRLARLRQGFDRGVGQDRVMRVDWFEVSGPFNPTGVSATPSRQKIFSCYPKASGEELPCAEEIVSNLAARAFRRPLSEEDIAERLAYYQDGRARRRVLRAGHRVRARRHPREPAFLVSRGRGVRPRSPVTHTASPISSSRRACRSSSGAASRTTSYAASRRRVSCGPARSCSCAGQSACSQTRAPSTLASNFAYQWLDLDEARRPRTGSRPVPECIAKQRPAAGLRQRDHAVRRQRLPRGPQRLDLLTAQAHLLEREPRRCTTASTTCAAIVSGASSSRTRARWGLLGKGRCAAARRRIRTARRPCCAARGCWRRIIGTPPATPPPNVETTQRERRAAGTA